MISQGELAAWQFGERDAILLADEAQIQFLQQHANPTWRHCLLLPVSVQAFAAGVRSGSTRVQTHFGHVSFSSWQNQYSDKVLAQSSGWLNELGLTYTVDGIDVAELDKANQFLFFLLGAYLERCAESILRAHSEIQTFYVVTAAPPLPLDFYFDSDVPAAMLQFICEREARQVEQILMEDRPYLFPQHRERPLVAGDTSNPPPIPKKGVHNRVGFVPATVPIAQAILDALSELRRDTLIINSAWGLPAMILDESAALFSLGAANYTSDGQEVDKLNQLWAETERRLPASTLPSVVSQNPYLRFQFKYILKQRWLWYASKIHSGRQFATENPLDLFIHPDTFTAEGAILSELYRQQGTPIVIVPHSAWPCDSNWSSRRESDIGITFGQAASNRLNRSSKMRSFVIAERTSPYRSLIRPSHQDPVRETQERLKGRRLVLFVSNAPELLCVPSLDLQRHLQTLIALANVPWKLRGHVLVAIRTKPRPLGEDPTFYRSAGFGDESIEFLSGLTFLQCLSLADCVVGVNVTTTGYFDAMETGVPVLHVQTAQALAKHPDLPDEVCGLIASDEDIWPVIEKTLFDPKTRVELLKKQREFVTNDQKSLVPGDGRLTKVLGRTIARKRPLPLWGWFRKRKLLGGPAQQEQILDPNKWVIAEDGFAGYVDDVLVGPDRSVTVVGWAADLIAKGPAKRIHVLLARSSLGSKEPQQLRTDVAAYLENEAFRFVGFTIRMRGTQIATLSDTSLKDLSVYAELHNGTAGRLVGPNWNIADA